MSNKQLILYQSHGPARKAGADTFIVEKAILLEPDCRRGNTFAVNVQPHGAEEPLHIGIQLKNNKANKSYKSLGTQTDREERFRPDVGATFLTVPSTMPPSPPGSPFLPPAIDLVHYAMGLPKRAKVTQFQPRAVSPFTLAPGNAGPSSQLPGSSYPTLTQVRTYVHESPEDKQEDEEDDFRPWHTPKKGKIPWPPRRSHHRH
ncbi:hypothetical protein CONPUDRAFT_157058 [Coniophora puteana RWD-64-598 SS2]|uniref:Uncharacterized protein n=1 Tax=Coniophora puteana (strain RWD-64-598) TaxID=741705 RepID=A0A5M3MGY9_CONPW|nr:uncharacterized protein CONPUDRAFT_157058 [Coniophora puteana RWD-64-598 SS2]EIW77881.1 hypothetical protein CONPUDRAFT_157058 [Coniophora puteana RWD-64-598 SS2]